MGAKNSTNNYTYTYTTANSSTANQYTDPNRKGKNITVYRFGKKSKGSAPAVLRGMKPVQPIYRGAGKRFIVLQSRGAKTRARVQKEYENDLPPVPARRERPRAETKRKRKTYYPPVFGGQKTLSVRSHQRRFPGNGRVKLPRDKTRRNQEASTRTPKVTISAADSAAGELKRRGIMRGKYYRGKYYRGKYYRGRRRHHRRGKYYRGRYYRGSAKSSARVTGQALKHYVKVRRKAAKKLR